MASSQSGQARPTKTKEIPKCGCAPEATVIDIAEMLMVEIRKKRVQSVKGLKAVV